MTTNAADESTLSSYASVHGEWETRPISIMGVVKRFISQLSYGQDLTRIAMPSEFLNPYSVLELAAIRYMAKFSILLEANKLNDPVDRMLAVLHWFAVCMVEAKMYKKPYNSVVGESHYCYVNSDEFGPTRFVGEQVSHHPPVSAVNVSNAKEDITVTGTLSFGVKFWWNSVSVNISGAIKVIFGKHGEEYVFSKAIPDMMLKNVVLGTRKMRWTDSLAITCAKTNCKAEMKFNPSSAEDTLDGKITKDGTTVAVFDGSIDSSIRYRKMSDNKEQGLHDASEHVPANIIYPPQHDAYPSMKVWQDVSQAIMKNDMTEADKAKQLVEEEQRNRIKNEGADEKKEHKYFRANEDDEWEFIPDSLVIPTLDS